MEDWEYDLEKLKVETGDVITKVLVNSLVNSMIEHRKAIEELRECLKSEARRSRTPP